VNWTELDGGTGNLLALAGPYTVAAQLGRATVWSGGQVCARLEAPVPLPGRPLIAGDTLRWGALEVELPDRVSQRVGALQDALGAGTGAPTDPPPGGGYRAAASAWSADGEVLLVSASRLSSPGPLPPGRALMLDSGGSHLATLWEGPESAPAALWAGRDFLAVGTREPRVFSRAGEPLAVLEAGTLPVRIEATADERLLAVTEHWRITLYATGTWEVAERWPGPWLDAALAPARPLLVAVGLSGELALIGLDGGAPQRLQPPDPVQAVAVAEDRIAAAFAGGVRVRTAQLEPG
jgi:hypothetical protein